jgi:hypothetical protein
MISVSSPTVSPAPSAGVEPPVHSSEPSDITIKGHSLDSLMQRVAQRLNQDMEATFTQLQQEGRVAQRISEANACMIATLQAANGALEDAGIHLSEHQPMPAGVEALIKQTAVLTLANLDNRYRVREGDPAQGGTTATPPPACFDPAQMNLHLQDIEHLHARLSNNPFSPFVNVPRHQRWRLCLDPDKVAFVEAHVQGARGNPLLPFMFDSTPGYLHGVLNGWQTSMTNLNSRLDTGLICALHRACYPSDRPYERQTFNCQFPLHLGSNMTPAGAKELRAFAKALRKTLPEYAVVTSEQAYKAFIEALKRQPEAQPDDAFTDYALLVRSEVPFSVMREHIGLFLQQYQAQRSKTPKATQAQRQAQAIELCQNLEQLHPFPDANARTFSILLLNHLLARDKLPLAMLEDPNRLDGWSKAELSQVLEQGQARVAQWCGQHAPKAIKPSKSGLNPLSNLRKLFKKT